MFELPNAMEMADLYNERQQELRDEKRKEIAAEICTAATIGTITVNLLPSWLHEELKAKGYDITDGPAAQGPKQDKIDWRNSGIMLNLSLDMDDK